MIEYDGGGIVGEALHYMLVIAFCGSALLIFLYLWSKGKLDLDESPAKAMIREDNDER